MNFFLMFCLRFVRDVAPYWLWPKKQFIVEPAGHHRWCVKIHQSKDYLYSIHRVYLIFVLWVWSLHIVTMRVNMGFGPFAGWFILPSVFFTSFLVFFLFLTKKKYFAISFECPMAFWLSAQRKTVLSMFREPRNYFSFLIHIKMKRRKDCRFVETVFKFVT